MKPAFRLFLALLLLPVLALRADETSRSDAQAPEASLQAPASPNSTTTDTQASPATTTDATAEAAANDAPAVSGDEAANSALRELSATTEPAPSLERAADGAKAPAEANSTQEKKERKAKARRERGQRIEDEQPVPFTHSVIPAGKVVNDAVSVGASTTVEGETRGDAVAVFGNTTVLGKVNGDAVAVFGNLRVDGEVMGEAVCVFGTASFGPNAIVHGESANILGVCSRDPAAQLLGGLKVIGFGTGNTSLDALIEWVDTCLLKGRLLSYNPAFLVLWLIGLVLVLANTGIALVSRRQALHCIELFTTRPGGSLLTALLSLLITPLLFVLLAITGIGALLIPFIVLGGFLVSVYGHVVMQVLLGRLVLSAGGPALADRVGLSSLLGGLILLLLLTLPVVGLLLLPLLGFLGTGVVTYALLRHFTRAGAPSTGNKGPDLPGRAAPVTPPTAPASPVQPLAPLTLNPQVSPADSVVAAAYPATDLVSPAAVSPAVFVTREEQPAAPAPTAGVTPPPQAPQAAIPTANPAARAPLTEAPASSLPRATFGIRMLALLIDFVIVALVCNLATSLLPRFLNMDCSPGGILLVLAVYGAALWKHRGATIGDIIFRLQVIRADDKPLDWTTCIIRALGCLISGVVLGLGFIWIAYDPDREGWHDKIAGTAVVRVPKSRPLV